MKVLHIVDEIGGGSGRVLKILENKKEIIWQRNREKSFKLDNFDVFVFWGYMPDFDFSSIKKGIKIYYFHGLRAISKRMLLNGFEYNPFQISKYLKFKKWLRNFDGFISCSFSMKYMAKHFYDVDSIVVYNGIDFESMPKIEREKDSNILLWIGRNAWIKGFDRFVKLLELLPEYEGWVLGVNNMNYKNVKFLGYVSNVYEYIAKARAVVITSYFEAFPVVCLETLYYNVPIISIKSAMGACEVLQITGNYELCFDSIEEMARYIKNGNIRDLKDNSILRYVFNADSYYTNLRKAIESIYKKAL